MSAGLTDNERNRYDIRERTKRIDDIGGRLSQFFADCAAENTEIFFSTTKHLTTHFSIAVQKRGDDENRLIVDVLGNGNIKISEFDTSKDKAGELHHFEIRTNNDLDKVFTHTVFEMALNATVKNALSAYGIDLLKGIENAQNEMPPPPKLKPKKLIQQNQRVGKGLKI